MPNDKTGIGLIGLGERGLVLAEILFSLDNARLVAVSDTAAERMDEMLEKARAKGQPAPKAYADYAELLADDAVDAVVVATPIQDHIRIATEAMRAGKYAAIEACGSASVEECWQLVHTAEATGLDCMLLENCCYGRRELALLNMVRQNLLGEIIYCEGGYRHDLREELVKGYMQSQRTRIVNYMHRYGDIYPTHGLGPIAQMLGLNCGNRMLYLNAMATKAVGLNHWMDTHLDGTGYLSDAQFTLGDVVSTNIMWAGGEVTLLSLDTTLPRPYSRAGMVQGTRGIWMESGDQITPDGRPLDVFSNPGTIHIEDVTPNLPPNASISETGLDTAWEPFDKYMKQYEHPLWIEIIDSGAMDQFKSDGCVNDGMDLLVMRAFVDNIGGRLPIDVYDTASILSISALSEQSVLAGGAPVQIPDFTGGRWMDRSPGDGKYAL